jgi:hypothetical protein
MSEWTSPMTLPDHCAADLWQRPDLARKGLLAAGGTFRQAAKTAPRRGARIAELSQKKISTGMGARFVRVDDDRELLLPPDTRQSVPQDPLVDFITDGVEELDVRAARVNQRGTGDEQYPPAMTLGVAGLVLCARNVFELGDRAEDLRVRCGSCARTRNLTTTGIARSGATMKLIAARRKRPLDFSEIFHPNLPLGG